MLSFIYKIIDYCWPFTRILLYELSRMNTRLKFFFRFWNSEMGMGGINTPPQERMDIWLIRYKGLMINKPTTMKTKKITIGKVKCFLDIYGRLVLETPLSMRGEQLTKWLASNRATAINQLSIKKKIVTIKLKPVWYHPGWDLSSWSFWWGRIVSFQQIFG